MRKRMHSISAAFKLVVFASLLLGLNSTTYAVEPPFTVKTDLFDESNGDNLGLEKAIGTETITVFKPTTYSDKFSNGAVMIAFKGVLFCQWQSSEKDEDAADTWVAYSRSTNGTKWNKPKELAPTIDKGYCSSGGWWVNGDTLVAYINTWPSSVSPRGGYTQYRTSTDGITWSALKPVLMADGDTLKGIFEQDPHALPDGRIINAAHFQPGLIANPIYTDDSSGVRGWTKASYANIPNGGNISIEIEPSWYLRSDDTLVMVFRDQTGTYKKLASVSGDRGESWTTPVLTNMPDSRSKQSAGNLADSTSFLVGNPVKASTRIPLVVTLSSDGEYFNTAYVLREGGGDIQSLRYTGKAKRSGYHYPKSMVWEDYLYVSYTTNKEDVEYTRVPLVSMLVDTSKAPPPEPEPEPEPEPTITPTSLSESFSENESIKILLDANGFVNIYLLDYDIQGEVSIYNLNGQLLYSNRVEGELNYDMNRHPFGLYIVDVRTSEGRKTQLFHNR